MNIGMDGNEERTEEMVEDIGREERRGGLERKRRKGK
jgi:hypothetical protein